MVNSAKKEIWSRKVEQGKYILRFSGVANNTAGAGQPDKMSFFVESPGQAEQVELKFRAHHQGSYQYPFSSTSLLSCEDGEIKLYASSDVANATFHNLHFVVNRVLQVN